MRASASYAEDSLTRKGDWHGYDRKHHRMNAKDWDSERLCGRAVGTVQYFHFSLLAGRGCRNPVVPQ